MSDSTVCVDASFVARLFLGPDDAGFWKVLERWHADGAVLYAPWLITYELTNVFYRCYRAGYLSMASARLALDAALALPIALVDDPSLHEDAVRIASAAGSPATYDAHYVALAERLDGELWTADTRLTRYAGEGEPRVRLVTSTAASAPALPARTSDTAPSGPGTAGPAVTTST